MPYNQDPNKVTVDREVLVNLARLAGVPLENLSQGQLAVRQPAVPNEYMILDDSIENVPELDVNRSRNQVIGETFH